MFISPFSTWLYVFNADRPLGSQLESLDALLRTIDKFANHRENDHDFSESIFIAFMRKNEECQQVVEKHIQSRHTYKYVYLDEIFALDVDFDFLRKKLDEIRKHEVQLPWSWLILEADILQYCSDKGRAYVSLHELEQHAGRRLDMSTTELSRFLKHLYDRRNVMFDDKIQNLLENSSSICQKAGAMLITDPMFLDRAFRELVNFPENTNPKIVKHKSKPEVNLDLKENIVSINTLREIWQDLDNSKVDNLANILVKFHLFIPHKCPELKTFNGKYIVPAMMTLPSDGSLSGIFQDLNYNLSPLVYWFDQSCDPNHRQV